MGYEIVDNLNRFLILIMCIFIHKQAWVLDHPVERYNNVIAWALTTNIIIGMTIRLWVMSIRSNQSYITQKLHNQF